MDYLTPALALLVLLGVLALAMYVEAWRDRRQAMRLLEAYRVVLRHGRTDLLASLQALALVEEEAQTADLPEVSPGSFPRPADAPEDGPLHALPLGRVPVPLGLDPLDLLDDLRVRKLPEPRS